jgi:large subunit ribosomal protein L10
LADLLRFEPGQLLRKSFRGSRLTGINRWTGRGVSAGRCSNWQWSGRFAGPDVETELERAEKREMVTSLQASLATAGSIVVAQNTGLTVAEMETLRKQMKSAGGQVKVAKNRLAKLALKDTDNADISALFQGPTVIAFASDPMTAPKIAAAFADKNQKFVLLGGAMGTTGLDVANVKALATMPSLDQLRATLAGMLKQPGTRIASILQAPGGQVARVLAAYADKDKSEAA